MPTIIDDAGKGAGRGAGPGRESVASEGHSDAGALPRTVDQRIVATLGRAPEPSNRTQITLALRLAGCAIHPGELTRTLSRLEVNRRIRMMPVDGIACWEVRQ